MSFDRPATVSARLSASADRAPESVALRWQGQSVTYRELDQRVDAGAAALQALGVRPGDRVALLLGNTPAFVEAHLGTLRAGGVVVPLNTGLAPDELDHALRDSGARILVAQPAVADAGLEVAATLGGVTVVVAGGPAPSGAAGRWRDLLASAGKPTLVTAEPDELAALVYTSGTTGRPRGAMLTHSNLTSNQDQSLAGRLRIEPEDTVLAVLPLFHIYALNVGLGGALTVGARLVLQERFDPLGTLELIRSESVSILLGAPPMFVAWTSLADDVDLDMGSVRLAVSGAAPLSVPTLRRFQERTGLLVEEGYGLTEASPSVTSNSMAAEPRPGSVGVLLPGIELRLVDDQSRDVVAGDPGEVWVRGANVFAGYWNDPEGTSEVLTPDGWLRTGDVGVIDDDGYLHLVDRLKDLIIVSGFNVYPREVERVISEHPDVMDCAVVGVAHPYTGEAVKAFVVAVPGSELTEDGLVAFCAARLAGYKCPEAVEIVPSLPTTSTGKVRRAALRTGS